MIFENAHNSHSCNQQIKRVRYLLSSGEKVSNTNISDEIN